jgi:hypothetical protein
MTCHRWRRRRSLWLWHCVIHRGIPHGGACPLAGGAHDGGGQYPWLESGGGVLELWPGWPAGDGGGQYAPEDDGG